MNSWFKKFAASLEAVSRPELLALDIERVCVTLLIEIARADHVIDERERRVIVMALQNAGNLTSAEINELVAEALESSDKAVSLYDYVKQINEQFDKTQKLALVEQMWRVAVADGNIDSYEEYTIRKLCDLLYLKHRDFMQTKLKVIEG